MLPKLCFYMGYTPPFNGQNYGSQKVYGSEITSIKLAESMTDLYNVYMFVNGLDESEEIIYNGVNFNFDSNSPCCPKVLYLELVLLTLLALLTFRRPCSLQGRVHFKAVSLF